MERQKQEDLGRMCEVGHGFAWFEAAGMALNRNLWKGLIWSPMSNPSLAWKEEDVFKINYDDEDNVAYCNGSLFCTLYSCILHDILNQFEYFDDDVEFCRHSRIYIRRLF